MDVQTRTAEGLQITKPAVIGLIGAAAIGLFQIFLHLRRRPLNRHKSKKALRKAVQALEPKMALNREELVNTLPRCPTMTRQMKSNVESKLRSEGWTTGRSVIVNQESNTISVFNEYEQTGVTQQLPDIPLFYDNIPIIPHSFPFLIPKNGRTGTLKNFHNIEPTTPAEGLYKSQLKQLDSKFPGIATIDYYLDRIVVINFQSREFYLKALTETETECFRAFGCLIFFGLVGGIASGRYRGTGTRRITENATSPVGDSFLPGCLVYNEGNEYSRIGTFLHPTSIPFLDTMEIAHFTVSAHSFMKKRSLNVGLNVPFLVLAPISLYVAYLTANAQVWLEHLAIQVFLFRTLMWSYCLICEYGGVIAKVHNMPGKVHVETELPMLNWVGIFLLPTVVRLLVFGYIEKLFPSVKGHSMFGLEWPAVFEFASTLKYVSLIFTFIDIDRSGMFRRFVKIHLNNFQGLRSKATVPILWVYIVSAIIRLLMKFVDAQLATGIEFLVTYFVIWDVVQFFLAQDLKSTFNINSENIIFEDRIIGKVDECYDRQASRIYPYLCDNDIAVGALKMTRQAYDCRPLKWSTEPPNRLQRLFLLGTNRSGEVEISNRNTDNAVAGALGGWRHAGDWLTRGTSFDYPCEVALIWRSQDVTIRGDSGSALVSKQNNKWFCLGFQSHEVGDNGVCAFSDATPKLFWKVAYAAPKSLKGKYDAVVPQACLDRLDARLIDVQE